MTALHIVHKNEKKIREERLSPEDQILLDEMKDTIEEYISKKFQVKRKPKPLNRNA